jgi:hypothetical protein
MMGDFKLKKDFIKDLVNQLSGLKAVPKNPDCLAADPSEIDNALNLKANQLRMTMIRRVTSERKKN